MTGQNTVCGLDSARLESLHPDQMHNQAGECERPATNRCWVLLLSWIDDSIQPRCRHDIGCDSQRGSLRTVLAGSDPEYALPHTSMFNLGDARQQQNLIQVEVAV